MAASWSYLSSLQAIRERASTVYKAAQANRLTNFDFHPDRLDSTADVVVTTILNSFPPAELATIPPHGRWQHFEVGGVSRISKILDRWRSTGIADLECCRRLIDLFFVSVLLDAGAGDDWRFTEPKTNLQFERSEGLAVASLYLFLDGAFGGNDSVDGETLSRLSSTTLVNGLQVNEHNPMTGVDGRLELLRSLGSSLLSQTEIFGEQGRPGNLVDYLIKNEVSPGTLNVEVLWSSLQQLLLPIWPKDRLNIDGRAIGDAWPLSTLKKSTDSSAEPYSDIQPFHKLTQWLAYSLMVPFVRILGLKWTNAHLLTGLPEYRNGGLFVDTGVLTLKPDVLARGLQMQTHSASEPQSDLPIFDSSDDVIVEWRAMTVVLLDEMLALVNAKLGRTIQDGAGDDVKGFEPLSLAQMLEAGTWKAGRLLAAKYRPKTKSSPILIRSDGTLF